jgi:hypothetical protein
MLERTLHGVCVFSSTCLQCCCIVFRRSRLEIVFQKITGYAGILMNIFKSKNSKSKLKNLQIKKIRAESLID